DRLLAPHHHVHQLGRGALRRLQRLAWPHEPADGADSEAAGERRRQDEPAHAPNVTRAPVVGTRSLSGICSRTTRMKFSPLQCMGTMTSGSSFLISATTWRR